MHGPRGVLVAVALALALSCRAADPGHARSSTIARVLRTITAQYPNPVSVSPAGDRVLVKSMLADRFELAVLERGSGHRIAADLADDTQLAPAWRADGAVIAYFAAHAGRLPYELRLWALDGRPRAVPAARTPFAALRWAPAGARLAYLEGELRAEARRLVVLDTEATEPAPRVVARAVARGAAFVWAPDGQRLATVGVHDEGAVLVVPADGGSERRLEVVHGGQLRSLAWAPDGSAIVTAARAPHAERFALAAVRLADGAVRTLASGAGDVSAPLYRPDGRGIVYHLNEDGEVAVVVCDLDGGRARVVSPPGGSAGVTGFSPDGAAAYVLHVGRGSPPALYEVSLDDGRRSLLFAAHRVPGLALEGERIDVPGPGGVLPAYLWRAPDGASAVPAAVIRVHGGPEAQFFRVWEVGTELLASAGYHVIELNYRGSTGYGATFERDPAGHAGRVADVRAAGEWAVQALGVPSARVFLFGQSYGAAVAAEAAAADARAIGGVVLVSLVGEEPLRPRREAAPAHVLAFHGENDYLLSPAEARRVITGILGEHTFERPTAGWRVLADEPHAYTRMRSWAEVYAAVLELLDGR